MADKNRNQGFQSNQYNEDWEQNKMRSSQDYNRNRENESSYGNTNYGESYNTNSLRQDDQRNQSGSYGGRYGRSNSMSDSDENRRRWDNQSGNYGSASYGSGSYGTGYGSGSSYGSGSQGSSNYGTGSYGSTSQHRNEDDWNRRSNYMNTGNESGNWGQSQYTGSDREDWGRRPYTGSSYGSSYNTNYGSSYGQSGNRYEGTNYENRNRGDRDWWDRTRDEVSSWFGDDDAERRRRMDKQNVGMHRGKGPRDYNRSEDRIKEDVCDRLSDDPFVDASDIDVKVEGTEVILSGSVDNREAKRRAEDLAESISGVRNVENRIKVSHDRNTSSGDTNERSADRW